MLIQYHFNFATILVLDDKGKIEVQISWMELS